MHSRLRHFRAALLLVLSSVAIFWQISFWFPFTEYLAFLSSEQLADYEVLLKTVVAIYISFCLINLIVAGLLASPISSTLKFWLALSPAAVFFLTPLISAAILAVRFPDRNFFEVFQAMFRLFRFTKSDTLALALVLILIATALNVRAAIMVRKASYGEKLPSKLLYRYLIYTALVVLVSGGITTANIYNSSLRALDRASCQDYAARALPALDEEVPTFLSDVMLYGQSAGTKQAQEAFITFSMISRQYFAQLSSDDQSALLAQLETEVTAARAKVAQICSEFAPETGSAEVAE